MDKVVEAARTIRDTFGQLFGHFYLLIFAYCSRRLLVRAVAEDVTSEVVSALNRKAGKQVWSTEWEGAMSVPFFAVANGSWIRATPALDGDDLFVAGIRDVLVCLDSKTGEIKWKVDFVGQTGSA